MQFFKTVSYQDLPTLSPSIQLNKIIVNKYFFSILVELPFLVKNVDRLFFDHVYFKSNKNIHINFTKRLFNYIV